MPCLRVPARGRECARRPRSGGRDRGPGTAAKSVFQHSTETKKTHHLHIALLLELPHNQRAQCRVLLPRVQSRTRRESQTQVRTTRLSQCALACLII